jgi:hypothetical protein
MTQLEHGLYGEESGGEKGADHKDPVNKVQWDFCPCGR